MELTGLCVGGPCHGKIVVQPRPTFLTRVLPRPPALLPALRRRERVVCRTARFLRARPPYASPLLSEYMSAYRYEAERWHPPDGSEIIVVWRGEGVSKDEIREALVAFSPEWLKRCRYFGPCGGEASVPIEVRGRK